MDSITDESVCRICFKTQHVVYSLFHKQKGVCPAEKLKKIRVNTYVNDGGSPCICCECLGELNVTINFLEKCETSNKRLTSLSHKLEITEQTYKDNTKLDNDENHLEISQTEVEFEINADSTQSLVQNDENIDAFLEPRCGECGSKRRCQHWTPPATHTCPYCQKVFTRKYNFKVHLKRHSGSAVWSCRACGTGRLSRWQAATHCRPRARRACPVPGCHKVYTTNTNLSTHLRAHTGERPFKCSDCGKKFSSKKTLTDHTRIHTGVLPYICPVCGKQFRTNKLSAHVATHAPPRLSCSNSGCSVRFSSRRAMLRHSCSHHPSLPSLPLSAAVPRPSPQHTCGMCPARYRHRQSLNKHVKKQHSQQPLRADSEQRDRTKHV